MTPVQIVLLHKPSRWAVYSLMGGFWAVMLGRIELRLRWPMARGGVLVREHAPLK